jgi:hypothetical protein
MALLLADLRGRALKGYVWLRPNLQKTPDQPKRDFVISLRPLRHRRRDL